MNRPPDMPFAYGVNQYTTSPWTYSGRRRPDVNSTR